MGWGNSQFGIAGIGLCLMCNGIAWAFSCTGMGGLCAASPETPVSVHAFVDPFL